MEWDDVLKYESVVRSVAEEWAVRLSDPDSVEDIVQELFVFLVESVNLDRVHTDAASYVRGACWKKTYAMNIYDPYERHRRTSFVSLDSLVSSQHVQISDKLQIFHPGHRSTPVPYSEDTDGATS
jgi:hypothetical protein